MTAAMTLLRAASRLRKLALMHTFAGVKVVAAPPAIGRLQPPRTRLPMRRAPLEGWDATVGSRMLSTSGGDNAQGTKIIRLLEDVHKNVIQSKDRDEAMMKMLQAVFIQRNLHISEDQGYTIIALSDKILANIKDENISKGRTKDKAEDLMIQRPTWKGMAHKALVLALKYCKYFKIDAAEGSVIVEAGAYDVLSDRDFQEFSKDLNQLVRESKLASMVKQLCQQIEALLMKLWKPQAIFDAACYVAVGLVLFLAGLPPM